MEPVYKLLREVKTLPPSPQVLPKVLDALRHEQTTLEEVGELISLAHCFEHPADDLAGSLPELPGALTLLNLGERHMELYDEQMQENWEFVNRLIELQ